MTRTEGQTMTATAAKTRRITFLPANRTVEVEPGMSILEAALENGIKLEHNCGGFCACTTCHVIVRKGGEILSEMEDCEDERLSMAEGLTIHSRLGCQSIIASGRRRRDRGRSAHLSSIESTAFAREAAR